MPNSPPHVRCFSTVSFFPNCLLPSLPIGSLSFCFRHSSPCFLTNGWSLHVVLIYIQSAVPGASSFFRATFFVLLRFGWRQVRQEGRVPSTRSTSCSTNMHRQSGPNMCCLFFVAFPVLRPQALYQTSTIQPPSTAPSLTNHHT